uniref:Protein kinase domain-containing protein n=1 Tax=Panagrolaimus sp. JU765 TaxID=591449 RepID=A0AC34RCQ5_9BILA
MADAFKSVEEPAPADPKENVISPKNGNGTKQNPQKKIKFKVGMVISSKTVKYTIRRKIGDSRLGAVYEVFNERDAVFCMKIEYKNPELPDPKLGMEIAILRHMRQTSVSPHFVEYIDRCAKPTYYFMVTSMVGPNLERLLDRRQGKMFSPRTAVAVTLQIVDALRELHQLGYVHRDIRPHN